MRMKRVNKLISKPYLPRSFAKASSFYYNDVGSGSCYKILKILPAQESFPTAMTTNFPSPVRTLVPDNRTGDGRIHYYEIFSIEGNSSLLCIQFCKVPLTIG